MAAQLSKLEPPEIVLLAYDAPPTVGGIQTHFAGLARGLVENGVRCLALAPNTPGCEEFDRDFVCPIVRVGDTDKLRFTVALAGRLRRLSREFPPPRMAVCTNTLPPGLSFLLAGARQWAPLGLTGYSIEFMPQSGSRLRGAVLKRVLAAARLFFAISRYTAENFRKLGIPDDRIALVYTGVDPDRLLATPPDPGRLRKRLGIPPDARVLLTVARLVPRKGHDVVLTALADVVRQVPDVAYIIAGDGPARPALERLVDRLGLRGHVVFAGRVPEADLPSLYAACDLFVMVPRPIPGELPEGFGIVYLEAALFEKPAVASDFGGVPDAVVDGRTGLLVPPGDPKATAHALIDLLTNPGKATAMGRAANARALREFTWKAVARRYLDAIDDAGL